MNKNKHPSYKKSFCLAMVFHAMVLGVLVFGYTSKEMKVIPQNEIVAAAVIPEFKESIAKALELPKIEKIKEVPPPVKKEVKELKIPKEIKPRKEIVVKKAPEIDLEKIKALREEKQRLVEEKREQVRLAQEKREQERKEQQARREEEYKELQAKREQEKQEATRLKAEQLALMQAQKEERAKAEQAQFLKTIDRYALLMRAKIHQNWRRPVGIDNIYKCKVAVKLKSNGEVISAIVINSSGNLEFDRSAELAIRKSSPLPLPAEENMRAPFNQFTFTFDPETA